MATPMIESKRITLRPLTWDDLDDVYLLTSDSDIAQFMHFHRHSDEADTHSFLQKLFDGEAAGTTFPYAAIERESGRFIGVFCIKKERVNSRRYDFSIFLSEDVWGKGYGYEIQMAAADYVFRKMDGNQVCAFVVSRNRGSCKILEKGGFVVAEETRFEDADGSLYRFQLNAEDYLKKK